MRAAIAAALLAGSGLAVADDKAVDGPVLDAARKAGYAAPHVVARGALSVVVQDGTDGHDDGKVIVVAPGGAAIRELATIRGSLFSTATATEAPFLGRQDLVDVNVQIGGEPLTVPTSMHYIVRTVTLEPACQFAGAIDSGSMLKNQRFTTTVDVKQLPRKHFAFEIASTSVRRDGGHVVDTHASTKRYTLAGSGACIETSN